MELGALDAFGRHACTVRERWRVLCRALRDRPRDERRDIAAAADGHSLKLQEREAPRLLEAQELAGV